MGLWQHRRAVGEGERGSVADVQGRQQERMLQKSYRFRELSRIWVDLTVLGQEVVVGAAEEEMLSASKVEEAIGVRARLVSHSHVVEK